jgi:hypothetical protein
MADQDTSVEIVIPQPAVKVGVPLLPDPNRYPVDVADLLPYLPQGVTINDDTTPSSASVHAMIINVCDDINGKLRSRGFAFPLVTTGEAAIDVSFLNTLNIYGALARWGRSKYPSDSGPGGSKGFADDYEKKYQQHLSSIADGALGFPDQRRNVVANGFGDGMHVEHDF